jgi:hypothetical protein
MPTFHGRVSDGTRTRDRLDHNQELYRLSYAHRAVPAGQGTGRRSESSSGFAATLSERA